MDMVPLEKNSVYGYYDPAVKTALIYFSKDRIAEYNIDDSEDPTLYLRIEKTNRDHHLENVPIERMAMKAEKARPKDWNLVNDLSSESTINILTKEKVITEENIKSITVLGKASNNKRN